MSLEPERIKIPSFLAGQEIICLTLECLEIEENRDPTIVFPTWLHSKGRRELPDYPNSVDGRIRAQSDATDLAKETGYQFRVVAVYRTEWRVPFYETHGKIAEKR